MRVLLRAPLLTNSGYGVHSRQIFEWLDSKKDIELTVECLNWGMTPWVINQNAEGGLIGKIMKHSKKIEKPYDVAIQVQLPDEWDTSLGIKNIGISAFVETDRCSPKWVEHCNKVDHVIVPSTFTKNVVKRSGPLKTPITVIPEWFNHNILNKDKCLTTINNNSNYNIDTDYNFLLISQLTSSNTEDDRKNIFNTIRWLCEMYDLEENVGIVLKTNMGKGTIIDKKLTARTLNDMLRSFGRKKFPKIHLIHGNMTSQEIAALYHHPKIKCFVSATRGEGYGLPLIDAAVAGKPIVATDWSGHLEFLNRELFYPIDYTMKEISKSKIDNRIFYEGFRWAEPKRESFIRQILKVQNNLEEAENNANNLAAIVKENFHKEKIMKQYDSVFEKIRE